MSSLEPQRLVSISLPMMYGRGDDVLDFHVVTVIDSVIALDPIVRPDRFVPSQIRDCYLTFAQGQGDRDAPVALKGHLYARTPGDWRFKVIDGWGLPPTGDERLRICAPVSVSPIYDDQREDQTFEADTVNLGVHGLMLECAAWQEPPRRARLTLSLPGEDEPVQLEAMLSAHEGSLCDFRYTSASPATVNRLASFIIEDHRASLRRRRAWYRSEVIGLDEDLMF